MPRAAPLQPSMNAGEFSPRMVARTDFSKYPLGCATLENMLPLPQGGATRRPGTRFAAAVKDETRKPRLLSFEFSTVQAYVIEAGEGYFRFFKDQGQIMVASTDAAITNGTFVSDISGWTDRSTGSASISHDGSNQRMNLVGAAASVAWAEQSVATTDTGQEHVLRFSVFGAPGDKVELRVGTTSTGAEILSDTEFAVGFHCRAFTPTAGPFYIQFRNTAAKTLQVDDVVLISNAPVEIASPHLESELFAIKAAQSADVMYVCHTNHAVHTLARSGHTSWSLNEVLFNDGPWLKQNATATTLTPSATSGLGITITASATAGINDGDGFKATDVGRLVRLNNPASGISWGHAVITEFTSTTQVTADVKTGFATANATADWRLGAWCADCGYPGAVGFQEQRLAFAGNANQPQTLWLSQSADFENMQPDDGAGSIADDDALDFTISADRVNAIRWLAPGKSLFLGTVGGEWSVKSDGPLITPTDIDVKRETTFGSANLQPEQMRGRLLFLQRAGRKVMEFAFSFEQDNFQALDMNLLSDHIAKGGIVDMAFQQEPDSTLWTVRADGQVPTLTYMPEQNVVGWARCIAGGAFAGGNAVVESVAVIPRTSQDEVWTVCKRTINGQTRRYVEYCAPSFESGDDQALACYSDSAVAFDGAPTQAFTGLDHLEGESVAILADGAVHPAKTVSGGQITLDYAASKVVVGLSYTHTYESLKWEVGSPIGTAQGQIKRIHGVTLMLLDSLTTSIGPDTSNMRAVDFREVTDSMDAATPLFTGEKFVPFDGDFSTDTRVVIQGSDPAPFTLLAVAPEIKTNPR